MKFQDLHARLVAYLSMLIRTGQLSERGLARRTDLSQPHVHNVLKGRRQFSMRSADQVLKYLHLDLLELVEPDDWIRGPRHG